MKRQSKKLSVGYLTCQHCIQMMGPKVKKFVKTLINRLTRRDYKDNLRKEKE